MWTFVKIGRDAKRFQWYTLQQAAALKSLETNRVVLKRSPLDSAHKKNLSSVALEKFHEAEVDIQTTVFIGSSTSRRYQDFMFTPSGYAKKISN